MQPCEITVQLTAFFDDQCTQAYKGPTKDTIELSKFQNGSYKKKKTLYFDQKQIYANIAVHVPGRNLELQKLCQYIQSLKFYGQGPLCISGTTGCGKTSLVTLVLQELQKVSIFKCAYINCIQAISAKKIYSLILQNLYNRKQRKPEALLQKLICKEEGDNIKVLVLDEIDQFTNSKSFIYNILEWAQTSKQPFGLILISNMVDLTEKLSNKIRSRLKFNQIIFQPYNYQALIEILRTKFPISVSKFDKNSIVYLCKKIASQKSDVRILQRCFQEIYSSFELDSSKMINIEDIQAKLPKKSDQIYLSLQPYEFVIKILLKSPKNTDITLEAKAQFRVRYGQHFAERELLFMLVDLRDFMLIEIKQMRENCELYYQNWGINVLGPLFLLYGNQ